MSIARSAALKTPTAPMMVAFLVLVALPPTASAHAPVSRSDTGWSKCHWLHAYPGRVLKVAGSLTYPFPIRNSVIASMAP